jgi:hypothetical protein
MTIATTIHAMKRPFAELISCGVLKSIFLSDGQRGERQTCIFGVDVHLRNQFIDGCVLFLGSKVSEEVYVYVLPVDILVEIKQVDFQYRLAQIEGRAGANAGNTVDRSITHTVYAHRENSKDRALPPADVDVCRGVTERSTHLPAFDDFS